MKKKQQDYTKALHDVFLTGLRRKERSHSGDVQPVYSVEVCSLAIVAALISLRMNQEITEPDGLLWLADAHGLLNNAKEFLQKYAPEFDSKAKFERSTYFSLPLQEAMRALRFKSYQGFWAAVERTFSAEKVSQLKNTKKFDFVTLEAIAKRNQEGKSLRARKARAAKNRRNTAK
jgi:hypothetical protein